MPLLRPPLRKRERKFSESKQLRRLGEKEQLLKPKSPLKRRKSLPKSVIVAARRRPKPEPVRFQRKNYARLVSRTTPYSE